MFKEDYIKDNERINPAPNIRKRIKLRIYDETDRIARNAWCVTSESDAMGISRTEESLSDYKGMRTLIVLSVIMACFFIYAYGTLIFTGQGYVIRDSLTGLLRFMGEEIREPEEKYASLVELLETQDVAVYETSISERNVAYILSKTDSEELIDNILAEKYQPAKTSIGYEEKKYYIADFADGSRVYFIIGDNNWLYIIE